MQRWQEDRRESRQCTGDSYQQQHGVARVAHRAPCDIIHDALSNQFGAGAVTAFANISASRCDSVNGVTDGAIYERLVNSGEWEKAKEEGSDHKKKNGFMK